MSHNLLTALVLTAVVGFALSAQPPGPASRPAAPRLSAAESAEAPSVKGASLVAHRPPTPLVRNLSASLASPVLPAATTPTADQRPREDGERKASAKAAVEADGYKRVTVLGRAADGTWQARAYRGATEVLLAVDDTGRVSMQ